MSPRIYIRIDSNLGVYIYIYIYILAIIFQLKYQKKNWCINKITIITIIKENFLIISYLNITFIKKICNNSYVYIYIYLYIASLYVYKYKYIIFKYIYYDITIDKYAHMYVYVYRNYN